MLPFILTILAGPVNILGDVCVFIVKFTGEKPISTSLQSEIDMIIQRVLTLYLFEI
jgi:hypothetical protein